MIKKILHVLWTFSLQDYWKWAWSKTEADEKVVAGVKKTKKRTKAVVKAIKGKKKQMRQVCLFIQWLSKGKVCLGHCRQGLCKKTKSNI